MNQHARMNRYGLIPCALAVLISACSAASAQQAPRGQGRGQQAAQVEKISKKFKFGAAADGFTQVKFDAPYSKEAGFGFDLGTSAQAKSEAGVESATSDKPFYFSVAVPEGTYKVTLTISDATFVKAETHRLMVEAAAAPTGKLIEKTIALHVHVPKMNPPVPTNAPGRSEMTLSQFEAKVNGGLTWDDKLTFEFLGANPQVSSIQIESAPELPVVYVAGDSTVTDQAGANTASWGQTLPNFLKADCAVANYAESGETMKSFITALRMDKMLSTMKRGDYLLIQFGHNDSKASWPQTYAEAGTTYKTYLRVFIDEARRRGATPILVSPMERKGGANGSNSHGGYPAAMAEVAKEQNVTYVDLHAMSQTMYKAMGADLDVAFNDATHHKTFGAYELTKCILQSLKDQKAEFASHLKDDFASFDPAKPDKAADFKVPASAPAIVAPTQIMGS